MYFIEEDILISKLFVEEGILIFTIYEGQTTYKIQIKSNDIVVWLIIASYIYSFGIHILYSCSVDR